MNSDPDDEGLRWDDETDPTHVDAPARAAHEPNAAAITHGGTGVAPTSSPLLIVYGIFGGAYLLYTVGWIIGIRRDTFIQGSLFAEIMYQLGEFLAIASPAIWLGTVLLLTRNSRPFIRLLWLAIGLVVVAPWPFILGGLGQ